MELIFDSLPDWRSRRWTCRSLYNPCPERDRADALLYFNAKQDEHSFQLCIFSYRPTSHVHGPVPSQLHAPCSQET